MVRSADPRLGVAREGWPVVLISALPALLTLLAGSLLSALGLLLLPLLAIAYFREADGVFPAAPSSICAPLSGRIVSVRRLERAPWGEPAIRIRLRASWFGGYALRAPVDGKVREPPQGATRGCGWLRTTSGADIVLAPKTGFIGRGSILRVPFGQRVGQARRVGTRRAIQVLDVYLPMDTRDHIAAGEHVRSGRSVLASLS